MLACCACEGGKSVASASSQGGLHVWHMSSFSCKIVSTRLLGEHVTVLVSGVSFECLQAGSMLACCACEGGKSVDSASSQGGLHI